MFSGAVATMFFSFCRGPVGAFASTRKGFILGGWLGIIWENLVLLLCSDFPFFAWRRVQISGDNRLAKGLLVGMPRILFSLASRASQPLRTDDDDRPGPRLAKDRERAKGGWGAWEDRLILLCSAGINASEAGRLGQQLLLKPSHSSPNHWSQPSWKLTVSRGSCSPRASPIPIFLTLWDL